MQLLAFDYSGLMVALGGAGFLVGVLSWWLSKLLTDKKEITILQEQVKNLKEKVEDMEDELKEWRQHKRNA